MPQIGLRGSSLSLTVGVIGAMAFFLQGYDQAIVNGLLTLPSWTKQFPQIDTLSNSSNEASVLQGTTVALYEIGCALGAFSCFFLGDRLGRRRMIFIAAATVIVGVILQATPFSLGQLIVGRIVTGLGVGAFTATVPVWVTECTKAHNRGKLVMMQGWLAIGGVCFATWLDFGFYYVRGSSVNWRFPIALQSVFAIVVLVMIMFLPESPRWLIMKEDYAGAEAVLDRLYDAPAGSTLIQSEIELIRDSIAQEQAGGTSGNPFALTKNRHLHRTVLCISINVLAQMTGVNIVTFYSNDIFQNILNYDGTASRLISGGMQIWQVICAGCAIFLIERLGRRKLLITCGVGMAVGQAGLAALTRYASVSPACAKATLFFDFLTLTFFPIGLFLLPLMYAAELSPLRIRARVTAMSSASNWLFNFCVAEVTPVGFANLGYRYYIIYACISAFGAVVFYLFCPETKGRALEDIDEFFLRADTVFDPPRIARSLPADAGAAGVLEDKIEVAERAEHSEKV